MNATGGLGVAEAVCLGFSETTTADGFSERLRFFHRRFRG